jgi:hypothetical protein
MTGNVVDMGQRDDRLVDIFVSGNKVGEARAGDVRSVETWESDFDVLTAAGVGSPVGPTTAYLTDRRYTFDPYAQDHAEAAMRYEPEATIDYYHQGIPLPKRLVNARIQATLALHYHRVVAGLPVDWAVANGVAEDLRGYDLAAQPQAILNAAVRDWRAGMDWTARGKALTLAATFADQQLRAHEDAHMTLGNGPEGIGQRRKEKAEYRRWLRGLDKQTRRAARGTADVDGLLRKLEAGPGASSVGA